MAATLTQERFTGAEWLFERKYDGIRLIAYKKGRDVRLYSRNRLLQNDAYPAVVAAIAALPVRQAILDRLREDQTSYGELMSRALRLASSSFEGLERQPSIYVQGTALLFEVTAGHDPESTLATMKSLVAMIEEKSRLVQLIDACMDGSGLTVFIGSEHQDPDLQHFSVVTSTYTDGKRTGAVGIIGPTRMRYSRAINVVDSLSRTINRVFDNS